MRRLSILIVLVFMVGARSIYACECVEVGPKLTDKEWLEKLDGVAFTGRVVEVAVVEESEGSLSTRRRAVTFEVEEVWKGDTRAEIVVRTGIGGGDCGISFVRGEKYFVAATLWRGYLSTGICDRTAKYARAEKLLRTLGSGRRPARPERKDTP